MEVRDGEVINVASHVRGGGLTSPSWTVRTVLVKQATVTGSFRSSEVRDEQEHQRKAATSRPGGLLLL